MPIRNLKKIFAPRSIAIVGASAAPGTVGRSVLENIVRGAFPGPVWPVNPRHGSIGPHKCFAHIADLPAAPDLAVICTPAATTPEVLREIGAVGTRGVIVISAGFREVGPQGLALEQELAAAVAEFDGLRLLGPNCLGAINPHARLNATFAAGMPAKGRVAFLSQSGALCTSVLDWAKQEHVGFSHFISVGNMLDVGMGDLIDYLAADPATEAIILYIESITDARSFLSAARAFSRNKPIIAYKAGRFTESAQAAASHTGAMAGVDAVYDAAFRRAGIVRIDEMTDMFDCAELIARQATPKGPRLAIVTNAGGPGVMATDSLLARRGEIARLADDTIAKLDVVLPPAWSRRNPVDVIGDATPERYARALEHVLADPGVDAALAIYSPQAMSDPTAAAAAVIEVARKSSKPVLASWMGGQAMAEAVDRFNQAGIPTYFAPEQAVRAFMNLVSYARTRDLLYETPRDVPVAFSLNRTKFREVFDSLLTEENDVLGESTSKALLDAYEIPVTKTYLARTADDAVQLATRVGYPVALKIASPQITHKTDVGGVALGLLDEAAVRAAFDEVIASARRRRPDATVEGVAVQRMIDRAAGHELIVGAKRDPVFGSVLMVGAGGVAAELYADRALELPPLSERLARHMLESLRCWPLLKGFRGRPAVNIDRLIEVLMRVSYLAADYPEIAELDVNPLLATPDDVVALDARVILDRAAVLRTPRRFSHLAIRPYPEEFVRTAKLEDGAPCVLRPIKPEDEPLWHELLASCSVETRWMRFGCLFNHTTHEMATRYCFIDYDRELALVAEVDEGGERKLAGVGRLVANTDHSDAEFAILVADAWQNRGLGSLITDACLDVCAEWGVRRVFAVTAPGNTRMTRIFRNRGFRSDGTATSEAIVLRKELFPAPGAGGNGFATSTGPRLPWTPPTASAS
ncbi:MAG: bifunctional acetate--CoA ligase family protein/GNAT family N-acetyltransferase [Pirellulales bacterium]|nr:bifunctional acetate--CoA ligase family protein/GNAT family N-acetyltransferase [Pirellulales bacterium]